MNIGMDKETRTDHPAAVIERRMDDVKSRHNIGIINDSKSETIKRMKRNNGQSLHFGRLVTDGNTYFDRLEEDRWAERERKHKEAWG